MKNYTKDDLDFMNSLSQAVLSKSSQKTKTMLYIIITCVIGLIAWMSVAEIDEITRGQGKVVPSGQNQVVQNLEGGIIQELLVREGDVVKKGQVLLKIDNKSFESSLGESEVKISELLAKKIRLFAQANSKEFDISILSEDEVKKIFPQTLKNEQSLYESNILQLKEKISQKEDWKSTRLNSSHAQ